MTSPGLDTKVQHRLAKQHAKMIKHGRLPTQPETSADAIDCACVIHGTAYDWQYVDKLYTMITRNLSRPIRLHVFTEAHRPTPDYVIKHALVEWPNMGGRRSRAWWYKMQLFSPGHFVGQVLYFDLDIVITNSIDWVSALNTRYFWTLRDFKYLWKPDWQGINSSFMYWDTTKFDYIWADFNNQNLGLIMNQYHGDQDYITQILRGGDKKFLPEEWAKSWRWQIKDGGMDMRRRVYLNPHAGSVVPPQTSLVVFHGTPKPHEVTDEAISTHWS